MTATPETASPHAATEAPRRRRTPASVVRSILLDIAAVLGSICILLVILALVFNVTIVMFKTGSMAPTIPAGSAALVHRIPASEARVGDVVTVDRPGELPITHRVVSTKRVAAGKTRLVLRGDANAVDDPAPYTVTTVRRVVVAVPGAAYVIVWLRDPVVIGILAVLVAALVAWTFWPERDPSRNGGEP